MKTRLVLALAAATTLSACFGGAAPETLFDLTPVRSRAAEAEKTGPATSAVVVASPSVPQELSVQRIPVRSGGTISYVKDAHWVDYPGTLFGRLLTETIGASGRLVLDAEDTSFEAGTVLTGHLQMFGIDADRREAVVVYDAALAAANNQVRTRRFEARVPVATIDAATAAPALNQAANQVAGEIAGWLGN